MFKSGVTIILIFLYAVIFAQDNDDHPVITNDFGFGLGLSNLQLKENTLNNIRHKNTGVCLELKSIVMVLLPLVMAGNTSLLSPKKNW